MEEGEERPESPEVPENEDSAITRRNGFPIVDSKEAHFTQMNQIVQKANQNVKETKTAI